VFIEAEKIADKNKDQFITEEHLILSLIKYSDSKTKDILNNFGIDYNKTNEIINNLRN